MVPVFVLVETISFLPKTLFVRTGLYVKGNDVPVTSNMDKQSKYDSEQTGKPVRWNHILAKESDVRVEL